MSRASFIRSLLAGGAVALTFILTLPIGTGCGSDVSTDSNVEQPVELIYTTSTTTVTTSTSTSTSASTSTSTSVTTETSTTTAVETTKEDVATEIVTEVELTTIAETETPIDTYTYESVNTNESDIVLLAQLVNAESSDTYEGKLMVASCVLNRMNAKGASLQEIIYAPNQFSTVGFLGYYTDDDYQAACQVLSEGSVDSRLYFFDGNHPDRKNHFRDINQNYLGAW